MEIRIKYTEELNDLLQHIIKMGVLVEEAVSKALFALEQRNEALADEVIAKDVNIDKLRMEIEDKCIRIIATEQPVASDLRKIMTTVKIVSHIERIGDHARFLARAVKEIPEEIMAPALSRIKEMAEIGISMLRAALNAFVDMDPDKAHNIAEKDAMIDQLHKELYRKIIKMMEQNPKVIEHGSTLLFLNRFMERLGDHVTNICDWVCFANTGKRLSEKFQ
jgi:phosphate transport system protein